MGNRKKKPQPPMWKKVMPFAVAAVAMIAGLLWALLGRNEDLVEIEDAYPIDAQTLLVYGNSGDDTDTTRWSTVGVLGPDGVIRNWAHEKGALRLIGVTDEVVWFNHPTRDVHARRLPSLELVPGLTEAMQNHGVLSNRHQVVGFTHDAVVLSGVDRKKYRLGLDASIERVEDIEYTMPGTSIRGREDVAPGVLPTKQAYELVKDHPDFSHPVVVLDASKSAVLALPDPPGFLVRSIDYYKGGQSQSLHRVDLEGKIVWSASVEDMMDAVEADGQFLEIVWVGTLGGDLSVLVQLSEFFSGDESTHDHSTHVQRLVDIDPSTGELSNARKVTREET